MAFINDAAARIQRAFSAFSFRSKLQQALLKRQRLKMMVNDLV